MFCPKFGNPDQTAESYCRQCGTYLPDLTKPVKAPIPPEQHIRANIVLSSMTVIAAFTLSILLWTTLAFRPDTPTLIYVTAGLLFAIGCWQVQTLWRAILLRKHLKQKNIRPKAEIELLTSANFDDMASPASVTDRTTRELVERR